jgi:hypothetical protein
MQPTKYSFRFILSVILGFIVFKLTELEYESRGHGQEIRNFDQFLS